MVFAMVIARQIRRIYWIYIKKRVQKDLADEVKRRIMLGTFALSADFYDVYYKKAQQVRTLIKQDFAKVFGRYDVIIGPTTPTLL